MSNPIYQRSRDELSELIGLSVDKLLGESSASRLSHLVKDEEWTRKSVFHYKTLIAAFVDGVVAADAYFWKYQLPVGLEEKANLFAELLTRRYGGQTPIECVPSVSLIEFDELVYAFLQAFCMEWNEIDGPAFVSRYSGVSTQRSYIDLGAAARNAANYLRRDREEFERFNREFDERQATNPTTTEDILAMCDTVIDLSEVPQQ